MDHKDNEIVSFNEELVSMDVNDMSVEQLERRLELAIGGLADDGKGTCGSFGGSCDTFTGHCGTF